MDSQRPDLPRDEDQIMEMKPKQKDKVVLEGRMVSRGAPPHCLSSELAYWWELSIGKK